MKNFLLFALFLFTQNVYGQIWEPILNPTTQRINDCSFVNENVGWIVTDVEIFKTTDGGDTWTGQGIPPNPAPNLDRVLNRVQFIDSQLGVIACGTFLPGPNDVISSVLLTTDGGETWENADLDIPTYNLDAILADPTTAYTIGQYGKSRKSNDAGVNWTNTFFEGAYSGNKLFPISKDTIYFVGLHQFDLVGAFGKTTNGGANWEITNLEGAELTKALYFHDALNGCIGGFNGDVRCTTDGGENWEMSESNTLGNVNYMDFIDTSNGWAVTSAGEILSTTDGGQNWFAEHSGLGLMTAISMIKPNGVGYAVGTNELLKRTFITEVEDLKFTSTINAFPNPVNGLLNIQLSDNSLTAVKIEIYNLLGHRVAAKEIKTRSAEIEFSHLPKGTYILKVLSDGAQLEAKTVVKI